MSHPESPPPRPPVNLIPDPGAPGGHEDLGAVFVLGSKLDINDGDRRRPGPDQRGHRPGRDGRSWTL